MLSTEYSAQELRGLARAEVNRRAALRMLAIANALAGLARAEAGRLAGMSGQALCDAIKRYNSEGLEGLYDRPKSGRPRHLNARQERELSAIVLAGPDVEKEGISAYISPRRLLKAQACGPQRGSAVPSGRSIPYLR